MPYKKIILTLLIIIIIFCHVSYADELMEENDLESFSSLQVSNYTSDIININARHAIVLDRKSKSILFGKSENETCKMASTTKILTAIVVLEHCLDLNSNVVISKKAARHRWIKARFICE